MSDYFSNHAGPASGVGGIYPSDDRRYTSSGIAVANCIQHRERADALDVDPVSLRLAAETEFAREPINGLPLFGAIRDAAPDAWGRRVIENRLSRPGPLPEVDYLDHAGSDRTGALDLRTNRDSPPRESTLPADGERAAMLIARFDRVPPEGDFARHHMVSALTMLAVSELEALNQSYEGIAGVISLRGSAAHVNRDRIELFKRMVFNILVTNNDDHLRNHAFLYDPAGRGWRLSPLYDVVPSPEIGTDRFLNLAAGPQGRAARLDNALAGAGAFGLRRSEAGRIIEQLVACACLWRDAFDACGVSERDSETVASAFRRAGDIGMRDVERQA